MGTVSTAIAGTGGSITASTWYFMVSYIGWDGESQASAEATTATTAGTSTLTLSWTAVTGALFYKVYAASATTAEKLVLMLPAQLYDGNGTPQDKVVSVQLTTGPTTANPTIGQMNSTNVGSAATLGGIVPTITASCPYCMQSDVPLTVTNGVVMENVILWDLDEIQGMGRFAYTNTEGSRFKGLVTMEPLAKTDDNLPFLVKTYGTLIDAFEQTCYMNRGLRIQ
jgi:hypothetical protein